MLKELLKRQYPDLVEKLVPPEMWSKMDDMCFCDLSIAMNELLSLSFPEDAQPVVRIGEAYHYKKSLYEAGKYYKRALNMEPPAELEKDEIEKVHRYAPVLYTTPNEYFKLMDVIAIHHPCKPLIAYHLFWEDDYNFPDDYDPCDHEQVWISYDSGTGKVDGVWSFYHSYILSTPQAVEEANACGGHAAIRVEWGNHGSLIKNWEDLKPDGINSIPWIIKRTYSEAINGGRMKEHPIKKRWPQRFEGSFEDYLNFKQKINTVDLIKKKNMTIKSRWSNAVIQQYFLAYNFAPKYDWPT